MYFIHVNHFNYLLTYSAVLFNIFKTFSQIVLCIVDPYFVINDSIPNTTSSTTVGWSHDNA